MSSKQPNAIELTAATANNPLLPKRVQEAFSGYQLTQAIYVAAKLGIADNLYKSAKSCEELAAGMGTDTNALRQLLQLLNTFGIIAKDSANKFKLTDLGSLLRSDAPNSILGIVLSTNETYKAWGNLLYSVQTGKAAFDQTFQMSMYEYLSNNAEANANFNQWMEKSTKDWLLPALETYNFSNFTHFVDVGGSTGSLTAAILAKHPNLRATIFDQAHVVANAENALKSAGVSDRCQIIDGDFFESIPAKGDLYIISRVLLNWDDDNALKILRNCCAAMAGSAKLLIMDFVLPNKETTASELLSSLHLLVLGGRLMRTEDEYYALLSKAGFQSPKLIQTEWEISFIEAVPIS